MSDDAITALEEEMAKAVAECDFAAAAGLRDRIHALRNGGTPIDAGLAGLDRQQPGAMGLGTSRQRIDPPPGWRPPKKPDSMTRGTSRRRG